MLAKNVFPPSNDTFGTFKYIIQKVAEMYAVLMTNKLGRNFLEELEKTNPAIFDTKELKYAVALAHLKDYLPFLQKTNDPLSQHKLAYFESMSFKLENLSNTYTEESYEILSELAQNKEFKENINRKHNQGISGFFKSDTKGKDLINSLETLAKEVKKAPQLK